MKKTLTAILPALMLATVCIAAQTKDTSVATALKVKMAVDGTFCFESPRGQLFFGKHEGTFYFYRVTGNDPWLRRLFLALPRLPLSYRDKMTWNDYVPVHLVTAGLRGALVSLLSSFYPGVATVRITQTFVGERRIESVIDAGALCVRKTAQVELDRGKGFASITTNGFQLRRINDEKPQTDS